MNQPFIAAEVEHATGITTTVASAGTPVIMVSATLLTEAEASDLNPYSFDATTGKFTVDSRHGAGKVRLKADIMSAKGENDAVIEGSWYRTRAGSATELTPRLRKTEPAAAVQASVGVCEVDDDAQTGDIYEFRWDSDTSCDDVVTRSARLSLELLEADPSQ